MYSLINVSLLRKCVIYKLNKVNYVLFNTKCLRFIPLIDYHIVPKCRTQIFLYQFFLYHFHIEKLFIEVKFICIMYFKRVIKLDYIQDYKRYSGMFSMYINLALIDYRSVIGSLCSKFTVCFYK